MSRLLISLADGEEQLTIFASNEDAKHGPTLAVRRWRLGGPSSIEATYPVDSARLRADVKDAFEKFVTLAKEWAGVTEPEEAWDIE